MPLGLILDKTPPEKRRSGAEGGIEKHFTEGAVMLAFAHHILCTPGANKIVEIHPDGEHAKQFDLARWLNHQGFEKTKSLGKTAYGGIYTRGDEQISLHPKSGVGDIVAKVNGRTIIAECKGGIINTKHAGQVSKLRKGLCELIGQLLIRSDLNERHIAVVPHTETTLRVSAQMAERARRAGIEIALISPDASVHYVGL